MWVLTSLLIAALLIVVQATQSLAGRPLVVDDAAPVPPGHLEIEFGLSHARPVGGGREQAWPVMTLAYGVIERFEIGLGIQRVNNDGRGEAPVKGFEDLHIATKFNIIEETEALPAAAFSLDVSLPTANRAKGLSTGNSDQAFTLILSKGYAPGGLHLNLGYLLVRSPRNAKLKNRLRGGIAADYVVHPALAFVGEVFGASRAGNGEKNEAAFQLGLRYAINPRFVLDAAAGRSLRSSGASVHVTAGLTWTIDIANILKGGN
ncbi:MAG: transporter [Candidatus Binatia bacterium]